MWVQEGSPGEVASTVQEASTVQVASTVEVSWLPPRGGHHWVPGLEKVPFLTCFVTLGKERMARCSENLKPV